MSAGESALSATLIEAVAESLQVNPHWNAAADYAGVDQSTLWRYRQRAEAYANRLNGEETPQDLQARRLYARARDAWNAPHSRQTALRLLVDLDRRLDLDPDLPYYEAAQTWRRARSRCERKLIDLIHRAAEDPKYWAAAWKLLCAGWPDRYSDRTELTGAGGGPIDVKALVADAEERAEAAIETIRGKRVAAGIE